MYFYNIWCAKKDDQYDRITQQVADMAHQGYLRRIAKVEQCLSDVVTCGMLSNCVRMVCDLLTCLGRHSAKTEPLLEITDG